MSALRTLRVGAPTRRIGVSPVLDPARRRASLPTNAGCVAQLPNCRRSRSFDLPGALLATIGLSCVTFGLLERSSQRTPSHLCGAIGLLLLVLFVLVERRTRSPLVPMELFQNESSVAARSRIVGRNSTEPFSMTQTGNLGSSSPVTPASLLASSSVFKSIHSNGNSDRSLRTNQRRASISTTIRQ